MSFPTKNLLAGLYLSIFAGGLNAQTIFAVPGQVGQATSVFSAEPFALQNSVIGSSVSFMALSNPGGSKIYLIQRSGSDTVLVLDTSNFSNILKRLSFGANGEGAALTPNGQRLLVAAGTLRVIDTGTDTEIASVTTGSAPTDVAVSLDGTRAFVLSPSAGTLTTVDLSTNQVTGTPVNVSGAATGVEVGPGGMVYVTATNRFYEIDPRTLSISAEIPLNGRPGEAVFTPDGKLALAINQTPVSGSSVIVINLASKTVAGTIPNLGDGFGGVILDKLIVAGNNRVYATRQGGGTLYEITLSPLGIAAASYSGIEQLANVQVATASRELPSPKYLFVATPTSIYRLAAATSLLTPAGQLGLTALPIGLLSASSASTAAPSTLLAYNATQTLPNTGGNASPLVVRALDAAGNPVSGAPVTFLSTDTGLSFSNVSTVTDSQGFAQAYVSLPVASGLYTITATVGGVTGPSTTFNLTVSGSAAGAGGLSIVSGNGQVVPAQFLVQDPMLVVLRDTSGAPIAGGTVTFQITSGSGTLTASTFSGVPVSALTCQSNVCTAVTDALGQASVGFSSSAIQPGLSFAPATITASSGSGQVNFTVNTVIQSLQGGQPAALPTVELVEPLDSRIVSGQAGQTIPGAILVRVVATQGAQAGQPIPGVGVTVTTGLDATLNPSAACAGGTALTDASGLATCDLIVGGRVGTGVPLRVNVGSFREVGNLLLEVTPGPPSLARIQQGNNQSGNPGQLLPIALRAQITDAGGNPLAGVAATFEVISGSATLSNVFGTSDQNGSVSALVTLGSTAGPTQIRVRAGAASAVFTVTTNVTIGGVTRVSGEGQIAEISRGFAQPLIVAVTDAQNRPVSGIGVNFTISGAGTLSASTAVTDANGRAQISVTAGATPGPITVTASVPGGPSVSFGLTARLPGPVFNELSFFNAASNHRGISPGSLAVIQVAGVAPQLRGCNVAPSFGLGALPTTLATVQVQFGATLAPIAYICNIDGRETIAVQVPFEMAAGLAPVLIRVGEGNTLVNNVAIQAYSPGIFEHMIDARRYAVAQRPDGSFVSNTNRAQRGELIRMYLTGLGQTSPLTGTNRAGTVSQSVSAPVVVGVNNAGVRVVSAESLPGVVGVYIVTFEVPAEAPSGDTVLNLAAGFAGNASYTQASLIAIQ